MISFTPTIPLWFLMAENVYDADNAGFSAGWTQLLDFPLGCEWTGAYGARLDAAQAQGIDDSATVRTFYHPAVAMAMARGRVLVCKNDLDSCLNPDGTPNPSALDLYEVWGGADNVKQSNQFLEFRVRRVEKL